MRAIRAFLFRRLRLTAACAAALLALAAGTQAALYVESDGDDANGNGSESAPYRTITKALSMAPGGTNIMVGVGLYDVAGAGEVLPLTIPPKTTIIGVVGPGQNDTDSSVLDAASVTNAIALPTTSTADASWLEGLVIRNAKGTAIQAVSWNGTIAGCVISNVVNRSPVATAAAIDAVTTTLVLTNTTIRNINSNAPFAVRNENGSGTWTIVGCLFLNVRCTGASGAILRSNRTLVVADSVFDAIAHTSPAYAMFHNNETAAATMSFDRCIFRNISSLGGTSTALIRNFGGWNLTPYIRNCLFCNIQLGSTRGIFDMRQSYPDVRNSTFAECNSLMGNNVYSDNFPRLYNCSVSDVTQLGPAGAYFILYRVNLHNTPYAGRYNVASSVYMTEHEPHYKDPDAGDYRLKSYSKLIDIGNNTYVNWTPQTDLSGVTGSRIRDGDGDGTATVDLGAWEYDREPATAAAVRVPASEYHLFAGAAVTVPVTITNPPTAGAIEVSVTYGTDVSGPATVSVVDGGPTTLTVQSVSPLTRPSGSGSELSLAVTNAAIDDTEFMLYLYDAEVLLTGETRLLVPEGATVTYPIRLVNSNLEVSSDLVFSVGAPAGTGSNTMQWEGSSTIVAGGSETAGHLSITAGLGVNTITLSNADGFEFSETGSTSFTLEVVGVPDPVCVSGSGSDSGGTGTALAPFRTFTRVLSAATRHPGLGIAAAPGLYDVTAGEALPLTIPPKTTIVGVVGPAQNNTDSSVLDGGGTMNTIALPSTSQADASWLEGLVIRNAKGAAIQAASWNGTIAGCVITAVSNSSPAAVAAAVHAIDSTLLLTNTTIRNIESTAKYAVRNSSAVVNANTLTVADCLFANVRCTGSGGAILSNNGRLAVTDSVFDAIGHTSPAIGLITQEAYCHILSVDRCIFRNITATGGGAVIANYSEIAFDPTIRNSLFHDIRNGASGGICYIYNSAPTVINCTFHACDSLLNNYIWAAKLFTLKNCGVSSVGILGPLTTQVRLYNVNLRDVDSAGRYDTVNSVNITGYEPDYKDAASDDFQLKYRSSLLDIGNNAYVDYSPAIDLAGDPRILDGTYDKNPVVDLGAYETLVPPRGTVILLR